MLHGLAFDFKFTFLQYLLTEILGDWLNFATFLWNRLTPILSIIPLPFLWQEPMDRYSMTVSMFWVWFFFLSDALLALGNASIHWDCTGFQMVRLEFFGRRNNRIMWLNFFEIDILLMGGWSVRVESWLVFFNSFGKTLSLRRLFIFFSDNYWFVLFLNFYSTFINSL